MSDKVTHFTEDVNDFISSKYNIQIYQLVNKASHFLINPQIQSEVEAQIISYYF